jgi:plastocyanin
MKTSRSFIGIFVLASLILASCATPSIATQAPTQMATQPPVQAPTMTEMATAAPQTASTAVAVTIQNFSFNPGDITVKVGTTVTWTNQDNVTHTVTSDTGIFDSGDLGNGATFSYTFTKAGVFPYHCTPHHASMMGTVTVTG